MPEGHVVHHLADALERLLGGSTVSASSPQGRFVPGARAIDGTRLVAASAHGKHLFAAFDPGNGAHRVLHVHLGMYGGWRFAVAPGGDRGDEDDPRILLLDAHDAWPPSPRGAVRLRLLAGPAVADLSGPSQCRILTPDEALLARARLGPDPLRADADPEEFVRAVLSSRRAIGELLMDQRVLAGVGNIYRAELLFRAGLDPDTPGVRMSAAGAHRLWSEAARLMAAGRRTGLVVTTDPGDRRGGRPEAGWSRLAEHADEEEADARWYVYRRTGRPCHRCGTPVSEELVNGRRLYRCRECQRMPEE